VTRDYLQNRLKILAVVIAVSFAIDYFQGETFGVAWVITKILTISVIVALLSAFQYLWTRRRNA
jgi:hypothetical protein